MEELHKAIEGLYKLEGSEYQQALRVIIVSSLADKLNMDREKVPFECAEIGNVSSASIPVCMTELKKNHRYGSYKTALLSGFGVGLSIASVIMDLSDTEVLETFDYE